MTHEELLAKISEELATDYEDSCGNVPIGLNALRAVVELHKPFISHSTWTDTDTTVCSSCVNVAPIAYPCPTIQAIEKELQ